MEEKGFDEKAAKKVLDKDFENLICKVGAGKTLTTAERAVIDLMLSGLLIINSAMKAKGQKKEMFGIFEKGKDPLSVAHDIEFFGNYAICRFAGRLRLGDYFKCHYKLTADRRFDELRGLVLNLSNVVSFDYTEQDMHMEKAYTLASKSYNPDLKYVAYVVVVEEVKQQLKDYVDRHG